MRRSLSLMNKTAATPRRKQREELLQVRDKCTLLPFLVENLKGRSRSTVKSYLAHRQVAINGRVTTAFDAFLHAGDVVAVRNVGEEAANPNHLARIVYEDDDILVVDKKYGAAAAQNARRKGEQTVEEVMAEHVHRQKKNGQAWLVNNLDRDVSGLLLLAKSEEALARLRNDQLQTKYVAIIEGEPANQQGRLTHWLTNDSKTKKVLASDSDNGGQMATTNYKILKSNERFALVELTANNEKRHQLRTQLAAMGTPIAGDKKYGARSNPIGRLCLHAQTLLFYHPSSGRPTTFDTGVPACFQ